MMTLKGTSSTGAFSSLTSLSSLSKSRDSDEDEILDALAMNATSNDTVKLTQIKPVVFKEAREIFVKAIDADV